jgi:nifR3 family TIM-barrel protein
MGNGFWEKLKKPISASAPMAGVTDAAFRRLLAESGKPDVIWTEMISLAGIVARGEKAFENEMRFSEAERPVVFQFFGSTPQEFTLCGKIARTREADGIDINMGCPDKAVEKQGAGATIMKSPSLAKEIIAATMDNAEDLPVSVKTRLGYASTDEMEDWFTAIAETKPAVISIHGRTRTERRKGRASWENIKKAGEIIKSISPTTLVLGNGDIESKKEGDKLANEAGIDGYMVGRAIVGNAWLFSGEKVTKEKRLNGALRHLGLFKEILAENESFEMMKKHLSGYASGFVGAKKLRTKLMSAKSVEEAMGILSK